MARTSASPRSSGTSKRSSNRSAALGAPPDSRSVATGRRWPSQPTSSRHLSSSSENSGASGARRRQGTEAPASRCQGLAKGASVTSKDLQGHRATPPPRAAAKRQPSSPSGASPQIGTATGKSFLGKACQASGSPPSDWYSAKAVAAKSFAPPQASSSGRKKLPCGQLAATCWGRCHQGVKSELRRRRPPSGLTAASCAS
mmetsp:Transcript_10425/g.24587  ORF Transcript_10425/g.24587 Transcript_10425/m.24587 type:complete len:200 (+) Transcript_10425:158-757(+)